MGADGVIHNTKTRRHELRVRSNDSATIDLIWREAVSFMHTDESHKTQYAPMAIMRIFLSEALSPELAAVYHRHRTISLIGLPGCNVGWDMPTHVLYEAHV